MQTVRLSTRTLDENISFQGEITVDGTGVHEHADSNQNPREADSEDEHSQAKTSSYRLSLSEDLSDTTKEYNEKKKVLPVIVIPCPTITACQYCQQAHDSDDECEGERVHSKSMKPKTVETVTLHDIVQAPRISDKFTIQKEFAEKLYMDEKEGKNCGASPSQDEATTTATEARKEKAGSDSEKTQTSLSRVNTANLVSTLLNQPSSSHESEEDNSYIGLQLDGSHGSNVKCNKELSDHILPKPAARAMFKLCYTKSSNPAMKSNVLISDILRFQQ